jgi:DNA/RNA-binding domain of Phe-tRNA-synthetase-like protein
MSFCVEKRVWELFPGMVLVVAHGERIDNATPRPEITAELRKAESRLRAEWSYPNAQSHPRISAWRQAMKAVGVSSSYPSAIESLCRQVLAGRELRSINPLVDFYNSVSLSNISPVGGWDVGVGRTVWLRMTKEAEPFTELGKIDPVLVPAGEVCYAGRTALLTRHFVWRQAEEAKIANDTSDFFLISEVLPELGTEVVREIQASLINGIRNHFGITARTAVLDAADVEWPFAQEEEPAYVYY